MNRLSERFSRWYSSRSNTDRLPRTQVLVVGSGYGGSVAGLRHAEMGYDVTILERGSEFVAGEFPADAAAIPTFLRLNNPTNKGVSGRSAGLLNWHAGPGITAMTGNGLGGGSLINAGILVKPVAEVFGQSEWPAAISKTARQDGSALEDCFDTARRMLVKRPRSEPIKEISVRRAGLPRSEAFRSVAYRAGFANKLADLDATIDPDKCIQCGDCMTGCNVDGAKLSLTETYLAHAYEQGARMLSGATVVAIRLDSESESWHVTIVPTEFVDNDGNPKGREVEIVADTVILSAGTFGSAEILQRSRSRHGLELSPALGTRISANGDSITVLANTGQKTGAGRPPAVNAVSRPQPLAQQATNIGPTITQAMDFRHDGPLQSQLLVEDGACPAPLARMFDALVATQWVSTGLDKWREPALIGREPSGLLSDAVGGPASLGDQSQILLTMGHDDSQGRLLWLEEIDRAIPVWNSPHKLKTYRTQQALFSSIDRCLPEARHLHNPLWRPLPESAGAMQGGLPDPIITTVHPLGGCIMGDDFATSVVDVHGRVRRNETQFYSDLYVLDGSIVPTSLGCNPLLTITALAEFAMRRITPPSVKDASRLPKSGDAIRQTPRVVPIETRPINEPAIPAIFYERLICASLEPGPELSQALNIPSETANAEMILGFGHHDWDGAMARADHELTDITGTLKIQSQPRPDGTTQNEAPRIVEYKLAHGPAAADRSSFIILSPTAVDPRLNNFPRRSYRFVMTALTWLVHRAIPDRIRSSAIAKKATGSELLRKHEKVPLRYSDAAKLFWSASEARQMRYQLRFEAVATPRANQRLSKHGVIEHPLPSLWVIGHKHVQYAAGARDLIRFSASLLGRLWRWYRRPGTIGNAFDLPVLKRSYIEQVSNPRIDFHLSPPILSRWRLTSSKPVATAHFQMDPYSVMQDKPPQLGADGDLTAALLSLSNYPALFARFALQTRLFDFRAPDYSDIVYKDDSPETETTLFSRPDQPEQLQRKAQSFDLEVRRGSHAAEGDEQADEIIHLRLWRYRAKSHDQGVAPFTRGLRNGQKVLRAKSVLLMHAFSQSGLTYTFSTTGQNLAEAFIEQGYEVWLLESRMSTRLGLCDQASTVDQIAQNDVPEAISFITRTLADEFRQRQVLQADEYVQIGCFGQCIGAASLTMALLDGKLNHSSNDQQQQTENVPKLWAAMVSQVHPLTIGARESQAKSWIPPLLRLATDTVPFAVRGPVTSQAEALTDRVLASLPIPQDEHCPEHSDFGSHEDNIATCRRIRFIEAPLFKHRNVNTATHAILNKLFGNANLTLFSHARRFVDYEMLVDENGTNRYVTVENVRKHMGLPVAFLHGEVNKLFDIEGARRSRDLIHSIHPYWIENFAPDVITLPGYGHVDPLIGAHASNDSYPKITGFFSSVLNKENQDDRRRLLQSAHTIQIRYPRIGPIVGWTRFDPSPDDAEHRNVEHRDLLCRVSCSVQMSSLTAMKAGEPGTTVWAYIPRVSRTTPSIQPLKLEPTQESLPELLPESKPRRSLFAHADIRIAATRVARGSSTLRIHIIVVHEQGRIAPRTGISRAELVSLMWSQRKKARLARKKVEQPIPDTRSRRFSSHPGSASSFAGTEAVWRRPVVLRNDLIEHLRNPGSSTSFVIGCCRYPGMGIDRVRADDAFGRILDLLGKEGADGPGRVTQQSQATRVPSDVLVAPGLSRDNSNQQSTAFDAPLMTLMLGDQIYSDATAGMLDPATPVERYVERYESAFGVGKSPQMARLLRSTPVLMTPDDHEYYNGYPHDKPPGGGDPDKSQRMATESLRLFQSLTNPIADIGNYSIDCGNLRFCVIDTRSFRQTRADGTIRITSPETMDWLRKQITDAGENRFIAVCTGSVVLPGLRDDGSPSNPIAQREGFEVSPDERRELIDICVTKAPGRFALISGDYHLASAVQLRLNNGPVVGCAIVAPPFYAPFRYINAQRYEIVEHDLIALDSDRKIVVSPAANDTAPNPAAHQPADTGFEGSGFGLIRVERTESDWQVSIGMQLNQYERFSGWQPLRTVAQIALSNT